MSAFTAYWWDWAAASLSLSFILVSWSNLWGKGNTREWAIYKGKIIRRIVWWIFYLYFAKDDFEPRIWSSDELPLCADISFVLWSTCVLCIQREIYCGCFVLVEEERSRLTARLPTRMRIPLSKTLKFFSAFQSSWMDMHACNLLLLKSAKFWLHNI